MLAFSIALIAATLVAAAPETKRQIGPQSGEPTYYEVGLGACGVTNTDSDSIAAVSTALFNSFPGYDGSNPANNCLSRRYLLRLVTQADAKPDLRQVGDRYLCISTKLQQAFCAR
ncbi:hypothetical protein AURDEDRAFT_163743 [Auricularia subglabra TFB-10046 SS5]|nr:hypothetical protein AURDEDRAFT_163743 [Auricularia subglabra TFB-10046 SS5]